MIGPYTMIAVRQDSKNCKVQDKKGNIETSLWTPSKPSKLGFITIPKILHFKGVTRKIRCPKH